MLIYLVLNPSALICFKCVELYQTSDNADNKTLAFCLNFFSPYLYHLFDGMLVINLTLARNYGNFGKL